MTETRQPDDRVWVTIHGDTALVRVVGRGSFKISTALKQFGEAGLQGGCSTAVVDLSLCSGMDSTFMGVLAGMATRLKRQRAGDLYLLNLAPRTKHLVTTLGLNQIARICEPGEEPDRFKGVFDGASDMTSLQVRPESGLQTAKTMLEAHEHLVELLPENRPRFKDVLTFLRDDLKKKSEAETQPG